MIRRVILSPQAPADLDDLYDWIADQISAARAEEYIARILNTCDKLEAFPERGRRHDALRPGLRVIGFERRASLAFRIEADGVIIDRVRYEGLDLDYDGGDGSTDPSDRRVRP